MKSNWKLVGTTVASTILATSLTLSGCSKPMATVKYFKEKDAVVLMDQGRQSEAAEKYARIGELLLLPEGFEYADEMFQKALQADPTNAKANLYSALTKPLLKLKGFIPRFQNALPKKEAKELEKAREEVKKTNMPELVRFVSELPVGHNPAENYHDIQRFARTEVLPALDQAIKHLDRISNAPISLNLNLGRVSPPNYTYETDCYQDNYGWTCTTTIQAYNDVFKAEDFKVDAVDLRVMKSALKGLAAYIRLGTAYSIEGYELLEKRMAALVELRQEQDRRVTPEDVIELVRSYPEFLVLESDHQLPELARSGEEVLKTLLDLENMKESICKNPDRNKTNSIIHDICIAQKDLKTAMLALEMISGPTEVLIGHDKAGTPVKVMLDITRLIHNPVRDLKSLLPTRFDAHGEPVEFPDPTFGGLAPNGDLIEKVKQLNGR